ncbi:hypothetical protein [uncultured Microbulbifer sp.]|uniref:hypothetical protein n=1 Tax=uncultured Microbulbifer sp. TaxID=348147 RepID=UPI0026341066|nr:hypothetical protein [uncultured Microbulbifer sp.]
MSIEFKLFTVFFAFMFLTCILFIMFGQLTVRKLRKNPETKHQLGIEFTSGWDILNVAQALAIPKSWSKKMEKSPISFLNADCEAIEKHTNKLDKLLAKIFTLFFLGTGVSLLAMLSYDLLKG